MTEQELRLHARITGARETAADIEKIGEAQGKLNRQVDDGGKPLEDLDEKQKAVKASGSDYSSLLSRIHPQLGAFAAGMINAVRISGDLANQQINLRGAFRATTTAIRNNWNALKLIGAGGLATAGIMALMGAIRAMREEWERATAAIKRHQEALNELKRAEQDRQKQIEAVSDVRRGGGLTAEASRRVAQNVEAIRKQMPSIDEGSLIQMAGLMGDQLTRQQLTQAAILHQQGLLPITPTMRPEAMMRGFERRRERFSERIDQFLTREIQQGQVRAEAGAAGTTTEAAQAEARRAAQRTELVASARREMLEQGGSTVALEEFIRSLPGQLVDEADVSKVAQIVAAIRDAQEYGGRFRPAWPWETEWKSRRLYELRGMRGGLRDEGVDVGYEDVHLIRQAEFVEQQLRRANRRERGSVTINQFNGRYYERSGRTPAIHQFRNGETELANLESF